MKQKRTHNARNLVGESDIDVRFSDNPADGISQPDMSSIERLNECLDYISEFTFPDDTGNMAMLEHMEDIISKTYKLVDRYIEKTYRHIQKNRYTNVRLSNMQDRVTYLINEIDTLIKMLKTRLSLDTANLELVKKQILKTESEEALKPVEKIICQIMCYTIMYCRIKNDGIKQICRDRIIRALN